MSFPPEMDGSLPYRLTDDPSDPCSYCVQWDEVSADPDKAVPMVALGVPADHLYRFVHDDCEKAVMQYVAESAR